MKKKRVRGVKVCRLVREYKKQKPRVARPMRSSPWRIQSDESHFFFVVDVVASFFLPIEEVSRRWGGVGEEQEQEQEEDRGSFLSSSFFFLFFIFFLLFFFSLSFCCLVGGNGGEGDPLCVCFFLVLLLVRMAEQHLSRYLICGVDCFGQLLLAFLAQSLLSQSQAWAEPLLAEPSVGASYSPCGSFESIDGSMDRCLDGWMDGWMVFGMAAGS